MAMAMARYAGLTTHSDICAGIYIEVVVVLVLVLVVVVDSSDSKLRLASKKLKIRC